MEVKRERYPYCVVLDFMVHYFKNEWRWDVDIKDTFDIYTKTIISPGSKSTLGSTTKKLEFGDDKKLDLVRTNVSFYCWKRGQLIPDIQRHAVCTRYARGMHAV